MSRRFACSFSHALGNILNCHAFADGVEEVILVGLLGFVTALPTTPHFTQYGNVYLPKNHFIREEALETERYLDCFYPFKKLNIRKYKTEFIWEVEGDTDAKALAMTFADDLDAMSTRFQKEYAEPLDWIAKVNHPP